MARATPLRLSEHGPGEWNANPRTHERGGHEPDAATTDFADDEADLARRIAGPTLVSRGELGGMHTLFDVLGTWRDKATDVHGHAVASGHFIPEEAPEPLLRDLQPFLAADRRR